MKSLPRITEELNFIGATNVGSGNFTGNGFRRHVTPTHVMACAVIEVSI